MMLSWITDFIVVSNSEKTEALKYRVAKPARLVGINNSIRIAHTAVHPENNVPQRAEFGLGENAIVVGSVGRLTKQKDWLTYLRAAKEALAVTDNIAFLIVGEGEELGTINRAVEKFGLQDKVITTGYRRDMNKIFSLIDIYINTSLWEGLPYVVVEAMMYKKPIIATNLEYGKIIMNSRSGYLVDVGEYKSIAAKIIKLVNDKKLRKRLGMFGYQLSKRHLSFKKFIYKHEDLYLQKNVSSSPVIFDTDETTDSICLQ
jgi:glycosyltransferase involved in cell wall biosynthesis